jgi:hypothetical protein
MIRATFLYHTKYDPKLDTLQIESLEQVEPWERDVTMMEFAQAIHKATWGFGDNWPLFWKDFEM